jgi:hypothetical protein
VGFKIERAFFLGHKSTTNTFIHFFSFINTAENGPISSSMQQQYCNDTKNDDRGLHSLRRLELIQRSVVPPQTTTTTSASTISWTSPRSSPQKKSVTGSWQKSLYKPVFSQSPISGKGETATHLRASSLPNLALSSSPPVSTLVMPSKEHHSRPEEEEKPRTTKQIEVAPGEFLRLIGAYETRDAVRDRHTVQTSCLVCSLTLVCANQADCVLCPSCRVVSPIIDNNNNLSSSSRCPSSPGKKRHYTFGGVGMGLLQCEFIELQQQLEQDDVKNTVRRLGASMSSF